MEESASHNIAFTLDNAAEVLLAVSRSTARRIELKLDHQTSRILGASGEILADLKELDELMGSCRQSDEISLILVNYLTRADADLGLIDASYVRNILERNTLSGRSTAGCLGILFAIIVASRISHLSLTAHGLEATFVPGLPFQIADVLAAGSNLIPRIDDTLVSARRLNDNGVDPKDATPSKRRH